MIVSKKSSVFSATRLTVVEGSGDRSVGPLSRRVLPNVTPPIWFAHDTCAENILDFCANQATIKSETELWVAESDLRPFKIWGCPKDSARRGCRNSRAACNPQRLNLTDLGSWGIEKLQPKNTHQTRGTTCGKAKFAHSCLFLQVWCNFQGLPSVLYDFYPNRVFIDWHTGWDFQFLSTNFRTRITCAIFWNSTVLDPSVEVYSLVDTKLAGFCKSLILTACLTFHLANPPKAVFDFIDSCEFALARICSCPPSLTSSFSCLFVLSLSITVHLI